ncbi:MAG: peptidoglycan-binding protein [Candidatus Paceibacterota bacterium]
MKKILVLLFVFGFLFNFNLTSAQTTSSGGCLPGYKFSVTTGEPCGTATTVLGCQPGFAYSPITGAPCTSITQPTPTPCNDCGPVAPGEIILDRVITVGMRGTDVRLIQQFLKDEGYYTGRVDGVYGPVSARSVRLFQEDNNLTVNGRVDANTLTKINQIILGISSLPVPSGPVISGVSGPQTLNVNQEGTWTINASHPSGGNLLYFVRWGDETTAQEEYNLYVQPTPFRQTGVFAHMYTKPGVYTPKFTVAYNGQKTETSLTVSVTDTTNSFYITTPGILPNAKVGVPYSKLLEATGLTGSYQWGLAGGTLPPGIGIGFVGFNNGNVMGTPTKAGNYQFRAIVSSGGKSAIKDFFLTVEDSVQALLPAITSITPAVLPPGCSSYSGYSSVDGESCSSARAGDLVYVNGSGFGDCEASSLEAISAHNDTIIGINLPCKVISSSRLSFVVPPTTPIGAYKVIFHSYHIGDSNSVDFWVRSGASSTESSIRLSAYNGSGVNVGESIIVRIGEMGNGINISGTPQGLSGLSYYYGSGSIPAGYYQTAWFFDQNFSNNNFCGNSSSLATGMPWTFTCSARVAGSTSVYVQIYTNGRTFTSNSIQVKVEPASSQQPSIISPNGGEVWQTGSSQTIRWNPVVDGNPGIVDFTLRRVGSSSATNDLYLQAPNTGSLTFTLPTSYSAGEYYLRMGTSNVSLVDESDGYFTITSSTTTPLTITTPATLPNAKVGVPYLASIVGTGGQMNGNVYVYPHRYSRTGGSLPSGINTIEECDPCSLVITGTPQVAGTYTFTVTMTNGPQSVSKQFTLVVNPADTTPTPVPTAVVGYLDAATCDIIGGWALNMNNKSGQTVINIFDEVDGFRTQIAYIQTTGLRSDVNTAYGVTGNHGFTISTPASLKDGRSHKISVFSLDENLLASQLTNSPKTINCSMASASSPGLAASAGAVFGNSTTTVRSQTPAATMARHRFTRELSEGSKGKEVTELQKFLNTAGFNVGVADGKFGPRVKAAVMKFQEAKGIKIDGLVGPEVLKMLNK